jgi:hypothetical protein
MRIKYGEINAIMIEATDVILVVFLMISHIRNKQTAIIGDMAKKLPPNVLTPLPPPFERATKKL